MKLCGPGHKTARQYPLPQITKTSRRVYMGPAPLPGSALCNAHLTEVRCMSSLHQDRPLAEDSAPRKGTRRIPARPRGRPAHRPRRLKRRPRTTFRRRARGRRSRGPPRPPPPVGPLAPRAPRALPRRARPAPAALRPGRRARLPGRRRATGAAKAAPAKAAAKPTAREGCRCQAGPLRRLPLPSRPRSRARKAPLPSRPRKPAAAETAVETTRRPTPYKRPVVETADVVAPLTPFLGRRRGRPRRVRRGPGARGRRRDGARRRAHRAGRGAGRPVRARG